MEGSENVLREYGGDDLFGFDGYPVEWHHTVKHLVREQAGHRCVRCGHPFRVGTDGEWSPCDARCTHGGPTRERDALVEAQWRILTVHHFDGDKGNCRWWNLAALCQRCHLSIQSRVVMDRRWDKPHTEWFQPYVAGFYAWKFLGEDLDRCDTIARLEELLALEHRQLQIQGGL